LHAPFNHRDWLFQLTCDERHGANPLDDREKLQEVYMPAETPSGGRVMNGNHRITVLMERGEM